jgi:hypothetical protein
MITATRATIMRTTMQDMNMRTITQGTIMLTTRCRAQR